MATPYSDAVELLSNEESEENVENSEREHSDNGLISFSQESQNLHATMTEGSKGKESSGKVTALDQSESSIQKNDNTKETERKIGEESSKETSDDSSGFVIINIRAMKGQAAMKTLRGILEETIKESNKPEDIRLLVVGKTGEGKSTFINGIIELGEQVAEEGASTDICTHTVQLYFYKDLVPGVNVTIIDSPGLQDIHQVEQSYIDKMKEKCKEVTLVFYCMKMIDLRLKNEDKLAMQKLHQAFGPKFWERVMFVFTNANREDCEQRDSRDDQNEREPPLDDEAAWDELIKRRFIGRVKSRVEGVKKLLTVDVFLKLDVDKIDFIPAGNYKSSRKCRTPLKLPDRENWLHELLQTSFHRMKAVDFEKLSLSDKIHLAVIIDNDGDVKTDESGKMSKLNEPATELKEALEKLGFCVLYFNGLSSQSMACLLKSFQHVNHSELASFALVILSKGKTHHVYDVNDESISFEDIFHLISVPDDCEKIFANVPKLFFFHLSLLEEPKKGLAFNINLPHNSVALAVSIHKSSTPAIDSFVESLSSRSKPLKQCFRNVALKLKNRCVDVEVLAELDDDYVFPTPYKPYIPKQTIDFLKKQLNLIRAMWHPIRCETVDVLLKSKDGVIAIIRNERIAKIAASAASLVVGGGMVVIGLALIPFTFGASIGLSVAGAAVGAVTGATGLGSHIVSHVMSSRQLKTAQQHVRLDQQVSQNLNTIIIKYNESLETYAIEVTCEVAGGVSQSAAGVASLSRIGAAIAVGAQGVVETSAIAVRTTARVAGMALAGATLVVTVPIDIGMIAYNGVMLHKSRKDGSGKSESNRIVKWFVNQTERMLKDTFTTVDIKEYDIKKKTAQQHDTEEADQPVMFENPECGYKVCVPVAIAEKEYTIGIRTILAGSFVLPERATLVSAVYDVLIEKKQSSLLDAVNNFVNGEKLPAPVTIEIEHCVDVTDQSAAEKMTFATATVDFDKKAFVFTPMEGGTFPQGQTHGSISLNDSSLLCILYYSESLQDQLMKYAAQCSYSMECKNYWLMDVTFTKCLSAHYQYIKRENPNLAESHPFIITAPDNSPCIELESIENIEENFWTISHNVSPHNVYKKVLDTAGLHGFNKPISGMMPSLILDIQVEDEEKASDKLEHTIEVKGTNLKLVITRSKIKTKKYMQEVHT